MVLKLRFPRHWYLSILNNNSMYIIVLFNLRSKAPERIILRGYGRCINSYVVSIIIIILFVCLCLFVIVTPTETSTLPFPVMHLTVVFQVNLERCSVFNLSRGAPRRGRKWRMVAVTSLPVGFTRLPAASVVALR